ncbi:hypothetical protein MYSTI_07285 [Myxococcus stipitatus DSM 14675]|uniref:Zinc-finger domain-containing protein n=1 Tax=Myxococcus stipitatus (strain DSM 14675 / JCM 12634 / Mx s8) TaxID=1278073 RepID=L7ULY0_MYXSD|nr:hypothetical protein [Myxococcus stipitatus]AGC48557.1 hypothetical protein MYSTI_07285 [Myxococcus stipitatus DSM 14675]
MRWYERHVDASLSRWAQGELPSSQAARLLRHAHLCHRCGPLYERWAQAHRALEGVSHAPSSVERQVLTEAGLHAALAAAAPLPGVSSKWPALAALGGAVAAALLAVLLTPSLTHEFRARGFGSPPPGVALRVFCATSGQPLRELHSAEACPANAMLAFAAGGRPPYSHAAVRVRGPRGLELTRGPFALVGTPGKEAPLELTVPLPEAAGEAHVTVAFASSASAALAALRGDGEQEGAVVLEQTLRVEEGP